MRKAGWASANQGVNTHEETRGRGWGAGGVLRMFDFREKRMDLFLFHGNTRALSNTPVDR